MTEPKSAPRRRTKSGFGTVRKLPSGNYAPRFTHPQHPFIDGKQNFVTAGHSFTTKAAAEAWLAQQRVEIDRGTWIDPEEQKERERLERLSTFEAYAREWIEARDIKPSTRRRYEGLIKNYLLPTFGRIPLKQVTTLHVKEWLAVVAPGVEATRKDAYELLRTIFNTAIEDELIDVNPCKRNLVKRVVPVKSEAKQRRQERVALTIEELNRLADEVPNYMRLLVLTLGMTGLRLGEARALRPTDLIEDIDGSFSLMVNKSVTGDGARRSEGSPKTEKSVRVVPLPAHLGVALADHVATLKKRDYVFHASQDSKKPIPESTCQENMRAASIRLGFKPITPHSLRHTTASILAELGYPATAIRDLLGHTTTTMTAHYTHTRLEELRNLVEALEREPHTPDVASMDEARARRQA